MVTPSTMMPAANHSWLHITQPAFTCRLRWEPKSLTLWDNRLCVHQAFNDYDGYRRELYRTTIAGDVPR